MASPSATPADVIGHTALAASQLAVDVEAEDQDSPWLYLIRGGGQDGHVSVHVENVESLVRRVGGRDQRVGGHQPSDRRVPRFIASDIHARSRSKNVPWNMK